MTARTPPRSGLLLEAEAAYAGVIRDPLRYAATARDVLARARQPGEPEALVVALKAVAWARHAALDNAGAVRLLGEAVRLATAHGLAEQLCGLLSTRAAALLELGRHGAAARDLSRASTLARGSRRPEVTLQQAILEHNAGRVRAAADQYRRVLSDPECPPETWIKAANNAAIAACALGRAKSALPWLDQAAELAAPISPPLVAVTRNNLAVTTFHAGDVVTGLRLFEEAGRLYAPAGLPLGEHYLDYSDALIDLRLLDEALRIARSATTEFERQGAPLMAAEARLRSARLAHAVGQQAQARADVRMACEELRRQRRPAWVARAALAEAEIALADGEEPAALLPAVRRAARTLEQVGMPAMAVEAQLLAGRLAIAARRVPLARLHLAAASRLARGQGLLVRLRSRLAKALTADLDGAPSALLHQCRRGLADLTRHRATLPSVELRALAAGHGAELGELGLRAVLASGAASRALDWMERTRAASLLTVEPPVQELDADVARLRAFESELRSVHREVGREPAKLRAQHAALERHIRRTSWTGPGSDSSSAPAQPDAGRLSDLLTTTGRLTATDPSAWLVELDVVDQTLVAVVVGAAEPARLVRLGPVTPVTTCADSALFAVRRGLRGDRFAARAQTEAQSCLAELRQLVIEPLGIPDDAPLVLIPAPPLHRVPWAPLHSGPVTLAPSATLWARSVELARATHPMTHAVALIAGPGLPGAVAEVATLAEIYPQAVQLLPPDSTVEAAVALVAGAGLAHLACHGRLRTDNPLFSALEFSDGALTVYELLTRGVAPRRTVLSACEAAVDGSYQGNEVLGFVSALMARGTTAVVASVVPLPDGATITLMRHLHEHLHTGATMATALHRARAEALALSTAPGIFAAWCGLTAYGAG